MRSLGEVVKIFLILVFIVVGIVRIRGIFSILLGYFLIEKNKKKEGKMVRII